ncbi:MAG: dihydroorotase [Aquiluna sp.]
MILSSVTLPSGETTDITIDNGVITAIGRTQSKGIDCSGLVCLPGLVDLHTHLREPGYESSETIETGSAAAAMGGYTAVFAMANTLPVTDSAEVAEFVFEKGQRVGLVDVQPIGAVTKRLEGKELSDLEAMALSKARVRVFSDDGNCVDDSGLMKRALIEAKRFDGVIAQHAQSHELTVGSQMNDSALSAELGLTGWPAAAEVEIIKRDIELSLELDARVHICHITTAQGLDVVRWGKSKGAKVTAEVTPHHLMLTEELVRTLNPIYKVNPPLRLKTDTIALREGLLDGSIDILATDHAPHAAEKKSCDWSMAANGMTGLEVAASVLQQVLIEEGGQGWEMFAKVASTIPSQIGRLFHHGQIAEGGQANLVLIDPSARRLIDSTTQSLSTNNPWIGLELPGRVVHTLLRGVFTVKDGQLAN